VLTYSPETIDTSHVYLNPDLEELVEKLAQNNHGRTAGATVDPLGVESSGIGVNGSFHSQ